MSKNLVIVESPAKAKTLKKFLGASYKIEASVGHVRDLPKSQLGVDTENDFEPKYITIRGKGAVLGKLKKEVKAADKVFLATDPDREGEAISWHLKTALNLGGENACRITFNEITENAVKNSIKQAREIDMRLVDAQQARRLLDRVVGYKIGPLLWKKVKKGLSAGRVQSAGLKIICDREAEIDDFVEQEYWTIDVFFEEGFSARLTAHDNNKIVLSGKDETQKTISQFKDEPFTVAEVKKSKRQKKPYPPFITSSLQQEASKVLNFASVKTMAIAQNLYEGVDIAGEGNVGLISYIRTDSTRISNEAKSAAADFITRNYGERYLSKTPNAYKQSKRAQDAHEAIRPSYAEKTPESLKDFLTRDQYKLYKLIWERFIASEMSPAEYDVTSVKINAGKYAFRASGSSLKFDGYLLVYKKNETEPEADTARLPEVNENDTLRLARIADEQHFTQPPPRYTEASFVKTLEDLGIGRPSTYAAIISILLARGYVTKEAKTLYVTELGNIVNDILKDNFPGIVDSDFTANMENKLDLVEDGEMEWKKILRDFYPGFMKEIEEAENKIGDVEIAPEVTDVLCEFCGRNMVIKYGRFGKFLACPGFPECRNAKPLYEPTGALCPVCGGAVLLKKTKKGRNYYGCEKNPSCAFMSWDKPAGEACPVCGGYLVIKGRAKKTHLACSGEKCGFKKSVPE